MHYMYMFSMYLLPLQPPRQKIFPPTGFYYVTHRLRLSSGGHLTLAGIPGDNDMTGPAARFIAANFHDNL